MEFIHTSLLGFSVMPKFFRPKLAYETGTFNPLHQVTLAEQINDYQRKDNQKSCGVTDGRVEHTLTCVGGLEALRNHTEYIGQEQSLVDVTGEEQGGIEFVCPLPREGEQEDGNHHRHRGRQNNLQEGAEGVTTVYIGGFFQFIGNALKEGHHHKDVEAVFEADTCKRHQDERPESTCQLEGAACNQFDETLHVPRLNGEYIEVYKVLQQRQLQGGVGDGHGDNHKQEYQLVALEFELS